jgi:hypothetical protein
MQEQVSLDEAPRIERHGGHGGDNTRCEQRAQVR